MTDSSFGISFFHPGSWNVSLVKEDRKARLVAGVLAGALATYAQRRYNFIPHSALNRSWVIGSMTTVAVGSAALLRIYRSPYFGKLQQLEEASNDSDKKSKLQDILLDLSRPSERFYYKQDFEKLKRIFSSCGGPEYKQLLDKSLKEPGEDAWVHLVETCALLVDDKPIGKKQRDHYREVGRLNRRWQTEEKKESLRKMTQVALKPYASVYGFFRNCLDCVVASYSVFSGNYVTPTDPERASYQLKAFTKLMTKPINHVVWIACLLVPISNRTWVRYTMASGGLLVSVGFLTWLNGRLGRDSHHFAMGSNLTEEVEREQPNIKGVQSRMQEIDDALLDTNPIILVGKSGVGKSTLVKAYAKYLLDNPQSPHYGKTIVSIDAKKLAYGGLPTLISDLNGRKDKVILFIDEIASLLKGDSRSGDQFKKFADRVGVPVITATTWEEYYDHIYPHTDAFGKKAGDAAFNRRLDPIFVEELDEAYKVQILKDAAHDVFPGIEISDEVVKRAMKLTSQDSDDLVAQPFKTIQFIRRVANYLKACRGDLDEKLANLKERQVAIEEEIRGNPSARGEIQKYQSINREIQEVEKKVEQRFTLIREFQKLHLIKRVWRQRYLALSQSVLLEGEKGAFAEKNMYLIETVILPYLDEKIEEQRQACEKFGKETKQSITLSVSLALIETLFSKWKETVRQKIAQQKRK